MFNILIGFGLMGVTDIALTDAARTDTGSWKHKLGFRYEIHIKATAACNTLCDVSGSNIFAGSTSEDSTWVDLLIWQSAVMKCSLNMRDILKTYIFYKLSAGRIERACVSIETHHLRGIWSEHSQAVCCFHEVWFQSRKISRPHLRLGSRSLNSSCVL